MPSSYEDLKRAALYNLQAGNLEDVYYTCAVALKRPQVEPLIKILFAQTRPENYLKGFNPDIRDGILKCLQEEGVEYQKLSVAWFHLLLQDQKFNLLFNLSDLDRELSVKEWSEIEPLLCDPYFYEGVSKIRVDNITLEKLLKKLRRILLLEIWPKKILKSKHLAFMGALAEACFTNEYVFSISAEENEAVLKLPADDVIAVCLAACYRPMPMDTSAKLSPIVAFKKIYEQQVKFTLEQNELKEKIPSIGGIDDKVSGDVRSMYEENPYPRWQHLVFPAFQVSAPEASILIAGCGTSKAASVFAMTFKDTDITAIDISRSSLSYGAQKKQQYGISNIHFHQCDILNVDQIGRRFDYINCSGVLHHMENPLEGGRKLLSVLKSGGGMHIGLYSTKARLAQKKAREYAFEKGYKPDPDGIRSFRDNVLKDLDPEYLKRLLNWGDFYSTSEVRDLFFHVQETSYTIPELRDFMDALDLEFVRFISVHPAFTEIYRQKFPDDVDMGNLDNWGALEKEHPSTFSNMYNFLCRRKGEGFNSQMKLFAEIRS